MRVRQHSTIESRNKYTDGKKSNSHPSMLPRNVGVAPPGHASHVDYTKTLARVLVLFQHKCISEELVKMASQSILCQVWSPEQGLDTRLKTNGQPFFVAGKQGSDMLSLFRCLSCRYAFGIDESKPRELGAPGRVFLHSRPEVRANVQQLDASEYHRKPSAELCAVESCLHLPVFMPEGGGVIAVIEVLGNGIDYLPIVEILAECLQMHGLSTTPIEKVAMQLESQHMAICSNEISTERTGEDAFAFAVQSSVEQLFESSGFASEQASKRLKVSSESLKGLMKSKNIGTISKRKMEKYESHVNTILQGKQSKRKKQNQKGIDSRWNMVRYLPSICDQTIKPPDGAFPIRPVGNRRRIEPDIALLQEWPGLESMKQDSNESAKDTKETNENPTSSNENESGDWLGMIDPFMLDLMMMNDFEGDGNIGNVHDLPPIL